MHAVGDYACGDMPEAAVECLILTLIPVQSVIRGDMPEAAVECLILTLIPVQSAIWGDTPEAPVECCLSVHVTSDLQVFLMLFIRACHE